MVFSTPVHACATCAASVEMSAQMDSSSGKSASSPRTSWNSPAGTDHATGRKRSGTRLKALIVDGGGQNERVGEGGSEGESPHQGTDHECGSANARRLKPWLALGQHGHHRGLGSLNPSKVRALRYLRFFIERSYAILGGIYIARETMPPYKGFNELSTELIIQVLSNLYYLDIFRCRRVGAASCAHGLIDIHCGTDMPSCPIRH